MTKIIQICGTGSGVGKSVITAGLCRIFLQDGYRVAPFKAQNMSLNSFVTKEGGEMGRAQVVQAEACRIEPHVDMNPILIKPTKDTKAQVILHGKPVGNMSAVKYIDYKAKARAGVLASFNRIKRDYEVIVIEGAGSPAEINLRSHDIVNMQMAKMADAPVVIVGDIDKGGVFAWLVGTYELLTAEERKRIKGFIINKFRGDKRLLKGGIDFLEKKTGVKVLGVIPYFRDIKIPEEDSVPLDSYKEKGGRDMINVDVIYLPHISNFTDFDVLENEQCISLRYVKSIQDIKNPDVIVIPGTKNTIADLAYLKKSGIAEKILSVIEKCRETVLIGICGGYQMLGVKISDSDGVESKKKMINGLGLLPITTTFKKEKFLSRVNAIEIKTGLNAAGYEIHHGRTQIIGECGHVFEITDRQGRRAKDFDGTISADGRIWGTYIHGIFDEESFRINFLNTIRFKKGMAPIFESANLNLNKELDKLAALLRENININLLSRILISKTDGR